MRKLLKKHSSEETEELIQAEIRKRVFRKEAQLEEESKRERIQQINIDVMNEMTEILTAEEIGEIAKTVREEFGKSYLDSKISAMIKWKNNNKSLFYLAIISIFMFLFFYSYEKILSGVLVFFLFGFPFAIVVIGIILTVVQTMKDK